jgi:hypothetical protein
MHTIYRWRYIGINYTLVLCAGIIMVQMYTLYAIAHGLLLVRMHHLGVR